MLTQLKRALPPSVKRPLRTFFGLDLLMARVAELELSLSQTAERERLLRQENTALRDQSMVLPGRSDAQVLLPLDYAPSRALAPRWGHSRPPIPAIETLFGRYFDQYREVLAGIQSLASSLRAIPREFLHENIPQPGWLSIPFTPLDAAALYYFVARYRPRNYLEIGSGSTTCFARRAAVDHATRTRIISIDPQPRAAIDQICDEVIRAPLETAPLEIFAALEPGDIVFLDGSHRSFMNSDVTVFMIDVLPMLKPGVIVHIHDIMLPCDYPDSFKHWYWNEQYLLAVYLMGNAARVIPLFPSVYVASQQELMRHFQPPVTTIDETLWRHGGSVWFTHTSEAK